MFCPFKRLMCLNSDCAFWVREDNMCSVKLAAKSLSEISTAMMTVNHGEDPDEVEEDLPFC